MRQGDKVNTDKHKHKHSSLVRPDGACLTTDTRMFPPYDAVPADCAPASGSKGCAYAPKRCFFPQASPTARAFPLKRHSRRWCRAIPYSGPFYENKTKRCAGTPELQYRSHRPGHISPRTANDVNSGHSDNLGEQGSPTKHAVRRAICKLNILVTFFTRLNCFQLPPRHHHIHLAAVRPCADHELICLGRYPATACGR